MRTSFNNTEVVKDLWWHVRQLGDARAALSAIKAQEVILNAKIESLIDRQFGTERFILNAHFETARAEVDRLYEQTTLLGCQEFERTGSKSPHPAISIGEYTILVYEDAAALELAKTKGQWLKLDVRSFKKDAKALLALSTPDPDVAKVVSTRVEPKARIKSDLSQWSK